MNTKLEYYADAFKKNQDEINEEKMMQEIILCIIDDKDILIDGTRMEDGSIDPAHIQVDTDDNRFYFHVYTSKTRFDACKAKKAYVLKLKNLLTPIFQEDTFGGITINYSKNEEVVLVTKENIYSHLNAYLLENKRNA